MIQKQMWIGIGNLSSSSMISSWEMVQLLTTQTRHHEIMLVIALLAASYTATWAEGQNLSQGEEYSVRQDVSGGKLNLRAGPGIGHRLVAGIPAGSGGVHLGNCQSPDDSTSKSPWCQAAWNGNTGWVSSCCIVKTHSETLPVTPPQSASSNSAQESQAEEAEGLGGVEGGLKCGANILRLRCRGWSTLSRSGVVISQGTYDDVLEIDVNCSKGITVTPTEVKLRTDTPSFKSLTIVNRYTGQYVELTNDTETEHGVMLVYSVQATCEKAGSKKF